ncbi:MAG: hypothetical protein ACJA2W_002484 [Planctomycetota bacterium]|jgi:hypothetical protein
MKLALGLSFALALPAAAQRTWIVDDDAGPGVDFQQIQPAFQAANHGDIVLVRSGRYASPVVLNKGLRVIAEEGVQLGIPTGSGFPPEPSFRVEGLPSGRVAAVAGFDGELFRVDTCQGVVVLDGHLERGLDGGSPAIVETLRTVTRIVDSDDVRVRGHRVVHVERSTVEFVQGRDLLFQTLRVRDASSLHLVGNRLIGQYGEDPACHFCLGGDGLPALDSTGSTVVMAHSEIEGGSGGVSSAHPGNDGQAAPALLACGGNFRISDVLATGGIQGGWFEVPAYELACGAVLEDVAPRLDPTLRIDGDTFPGSVLTIRIEGTPGDNVRLLLGRAAIRQSVPGSPVDLLVQPDRLSPLGAIPPSGRIEFSITIPVQWTTGTLLHLQASAVEPGGQATMTGSVPLLIR